MPEAARRLPDHVRESRRAAPRPRAAIRISDVRPWLDDPGRISAVARWNGVTSSARSHADSDRRSPRSTDTTARPVRRRFPGSTPRVEARNRGKTGTVAARRTPRKSSDSEPHRSPRFERDRHAAECVLADSRLAPDTSHGRHSACPGRPRRTVQGGPAVAPSVPARLQPWTVGSTSPSRTRVTAKATGVQRIGPGPECRGTGNGARELAERPTGRTRAASPGRR